MPGVSIGTMMIEMPWCFLTSGFGAHREPAVVGVAGERRPHLLAVDHVLVAVAHRARGERREVGAGAGLRVADAEVDVAREDLREEELLLLVGAEAHDRRPDAC